MLLSMTGAVSCRCGICISLSPPVPNEVRVPHPYIFICMCWPFYISLCSRTIAAHQLMSFVDWNRLKIKLIVLYCIVLYCIVLYCIGPPLPCAHPFHIISMSSCSHPTYPHPKETHTHSKPISSLCPPIICAPDQCVHGCPIILHSPPPPLPYTNAPPPPFSSLLLLPSFFSTGGSVHPDGLFKTGWNRHSERKLPSGRLHWSPMEGAGSEQVQWRGSNNRACHHGGYQWDYCPDAPIKINKK